MRVIHFLTFTLAVGLLTLAGCGGGGSSSSDMGDTPTGGETESPDTAITISGILTGDSFAQSYWFNKLSDGLFTPAYAVGGKPDKAVAISKAGKVLEEADVNSDGSFEINVSNLPENNFLVFMKDSATNEVYGHVKLSANNGLSKLDVFDKKMIEDDLDLGNLDVLDMTGPSVEECLVFSNESKKVLQELSNNDDALVTLKNGMVNRGIESFVSMRFHFDSILSLQNRFFDISSFSEGANFRGMSPLFYYHGPEDESMTNVTLFPPSDILYSDPMNLRDDFNCRFSANQMDGIHKQVSYNTKAELVTIETAYVDSLPRGQWILKNDDTGTILGAFEFSEAMPFNNSSIFKAFVPAPRIDTDGAGNVTSVTLAFYRYDNSGPKPIAKGFLGKISRNLLVSYVVNSENTTSNMRVVEAAEDATQVQFQPSEAIKITDLDRMIISYQIGEAKYQFFVE